MEPHTLILNNLKVVHHMDPPPQNEVCKGTAKPESKASFDPEEPLMIRNTCEKTSMT